MCILYVHTILYVSHVTQQWQAQDAKPRPHCIRKCTHSALNTVQVPSEMVNTTVINFGQYEFDKITEW